MLFWAFRPQCRGLFCLFSGQKGDFPGKCKIPAMRLPRALRFLFIGRQSTAKALPGFFSPMVAAGRGLRYNGDVPRKCGTQRTAQKSKKQKAPVKRTGVLAERPDDAGPAPYFGGKFVMKKITRRSFIAVCSVAAAAIALTACGGSASSASASTPASSAAASSSAVRQRGYRRFHLDEERGRRSERGIC